MDTEIRCFIKPEVGDERRKFSRELKVEAIKLVRERGVCICGANRPRPGRFMRTCCASG